MPERDQPKVTRRWLIARLGVGAAEIATSLATAKAVEPISRSLFMAGSMTVVFTLLRERNALPGYNGDPIVMGVGMGVGTYIGNEIIKIYSSNP